MGDEVGVEVVNLGQGEFQHDEPIGSNLSEVVENLFLEERLGLCLGGTVDVDLGLDDRNQAGRENPIGKLELLGDDRLDASLITDLDH